MGLINGFKGLIVPTSINLNASSISLKAGTTYKLMSTIYPINSSNQRVIWTSSNPQIATVDEFGNISALQDGECVISATTECGGYSATCNCNIYVIHTTGISLDKDLIYLYEGEPTQLIASVSPSDASFPQVIWSTSNSNIASVSNNGLVTFVSEGECIVTATTVDGGYTASCTIICDVAQPVSITFSYTGADQEYIIPYTQCYKLEARGAGGRSAKGGYASGTMCIIKGTVYKIMVGARGNNGNGTKYGFGGSANGGSNAAGGGLSGIFTGNITITADDSTRAVVIGGGAGGNSAGTGGAGGGENGGTGTGSFGTAGGGATQSGHGSGGNVGGAQFCGGNGSGTYGYGGGGGWRGGNGSRGDSSADDDKGGGGGSGYVLSTMSDRVLTQGGGSAAGCDGCIKISSI